MGEGDILAQPGKNSRKEWKTVYAFILAHLVICSVFRRKMNSQLQPMPEIILQIEDNSPMLNPAELADFLFYFRAVNSALKQTVPLKNLTQLREPSDKEFKAYAKRLRGLSPKELNELFDTSTGAELIQIGHIARNSPLELVSCQVSSLNNKER